MNFLCKLSKFGIIFFYVASFNPLNLNVLLAQNKELGLAYIQNITPVSSPDIIQYNSIVQDSKGFLFIGGDNGVLRYDGTCWQQLNLPGPVSVCNYQDGKIIARGNNYFGIIDYLADGSMYFTSLYNSENDDVNPIGIITRIWPLHEILIIQTSTGIFTWDSCKFIPVRIPGKPGSVLCKGDSLIMHIPGYGLYTLYNSGIQLVKMGESLAEFHVTDIIDFNDQFLIYTEEKGFLIFHNGKLSDFNPGINRFLNDNRYCHGIYDRKGNLILSTDKGSLVIFDPVNETAHYYHVEEGLPGTSINDIYEGKSGNLWVLHDFNISRFEWPSAFSFFDSRNGLSGNVNGMTRFEEHIFASTSNGIYILNEADQSNSQFTASKFKEIKNSGANCTRLLDCGKILLGISEKGIVSLKDYEAILVYPGKINTLYRLKSNPDIVLAGTDNGIVSMDISSVKYVTAPVAGNFSLPVRDIAETIDNSLWISSGDGGIFRFSLASGLSGKMSYTRYDTANGLPDKNNWIKMEEVDNKLLFSTNKGFYYFDESANEFLPYLPLRIDDLQGKVIAATPLFKDYENNLWLRITQQESNETEIWKADYCSADCFEISLFNISRFGDQVVRAIYAEPDSIVWIGSQEKLIRFDRRAFDNSAREISVCIYKIDIGKENHIIPDPKILPTDRIKNKPLKIRFSQNIVRFNYVSTAYTGEGKGLFQYSLDGYNNEWSKWNVQGFASFSRLSPGTYTFHVRSQDIFGNISPSDNFIFHISVPLILKWWAILIYLLIIIAIIYFLRRWKNYQDFQKRYKLEEIIRERTEALLKEKEKSESLIANILPKNTADELKSTGKATSSKFKMVTVLFADIQGFTKIAEQMNPEKLIDELDKFYFQFDTVVEKFNIEKIKTIGDAYMAAGGIPVKNRTNPVEVVLAALQMQQYMKELKKTKTDIWDLRIGIHTGSVIAGVIGQKKFSYDIWGDSVNTASRMESSGEIGKVNISATTYELVKDFFNCQYRGKMPVKFKGDIEMYFVKGIKPEFQADDDVTPNEEFKIQLQGLRLLDLEEFIIQKLKNELADTLYFHNVQHTSHVHYQAELLGRSENVSSEELLLIRSAALCHDIGYIDAVAGHEERSVQMAREILPIYRYTDDQIDVICKLILATRMPPDPTNLIEKIICDANFDHIGRVDFLIESDRLFQEYRTLGKVSSKKEWNELQIDFLKKFNFFTSTAQKMREVAREQQIENIIRFS